MKDKKNTKLSQALTRAWEIVPGRITAVDEKGVFIALKDRELALSYIGRAFDNARTNARRLYVGQKVSVLRADIFPGKKNRVKITRFVVENGDREVPVRRVLPEKRKGKVEGVIIALLKNGLIVKAVKGAVKDETFFVPADADITFPKGIEVLPHRGGKVVFDLSNAVPTRKGWGLRSITLLG